MHQPHQPAASAPRAEISADRVESARRVLDLAAEAVERAKAERERALADYERAIGPARSVFRLQVADVVTSITVYPEAASRDDLPDDHRDRACRAFEGPGYMVLDRLSPPDPPLPPAPELMLSTTNSKEHQSLRDREPRAGVDPETWRLYRAAAKADRRDRRALRRHERMMNLEERASSEAKRAGEAARVASHALAARLASLGMSPTEDGYGECAAVVIGVHAVTLAETTLKGKPLTVLMNPLWRPEASAV